MPLKLGQNVHTMANAPVYVARAKGFYEAEGLLLTFIMLESGATALQGVIGGDLDAAVSSSGDMVVAAVKGLPVQAVVGIIKQTMDLVARRGYVAQKRVDVKAPLRERLLALKGATLGMTRVGAITDLYLRWLLRQGGLDPDRDVQIVQIGGPGPIAAGLKAGRIDGVLWSPPFGEQAEADGYGLPYIRSAEIPAFEPFIHEVIFVRRDRAAGRPEAIRAASRATALGNNFALDQPEESIRILQGYWPKVAPAVVASAFQALRPRIPRDGMMAPDNWTSVVDVLHAAGLIKEQADPREGVLWTNRYLRGEPR